MKSILLKEIRSFFSSLVGYIVIILFILVTGLFMWILPDTNMFDYGYASMEKFFSFVPWILIFLIPAITMRMLADEFKSGTIEMLSTKPLKESSIIYGKFWASFLLVCICLAPTILYVLTLTSLSIQESTGDYSYFYPHLSIAGFIMLALFGLRYFLLSKNKPDSIVRIVNIILLICLFIFIGLLGYILFYYVLNNLDVGGIIGSYVGLLFLIAAFTSIGLFCSALTDNQIVAFLIAVFLNFILFQGFESISDLPALSGGWDYMISQIGLQFHYDSISRGVLDTRDLIYFVSVSLLFIFATRLFLQKRKWQ